MTKSTPKADKPKATKKTKSKKTAPKQETDAVDLTPGLSNLAVNTENDALIDSDVVKTITITDEDDLTTVNLDAAITKLTDHHTNINPEAFLMHCINEVDKYITGLRAELTKNHMDICSNRRNIRSQRVKELSKANMSSSVSYIMDLYQFNPSLAIMVTRALENPEKSIKDVVAESLDEVVQNGWDATDIYKQ